MSSDSVTTALFLRFGDRFVDLVATEIVAGIFADLAAKLMVARRFEYRKRISCDA